MTDRGRAREEQDSSNGDKLSTRPKKPIQAYVPPAKRVKTEKFDVASEEYQKCQWAESKKKITGLINRANISNVTIIVKELFKFNLIRYKGLFASSLLKAQETSPVYTDVYAALLAVINSRIKTIGKLLIDRLILQFMVSFRTNNKPKCLASVKFIAHLINQDLVSEALGFHIIQLLMTVPTSASIEIVITFIKECGRKLDELNKQCLFEVFRTLRDLSQENEFDSRTQEMIDMLHVTRRNDFSDFPTTKPELDLIDEEDKEDFTHDIDLDENKPKKEDFHMEYNYFKFDPKWTETEAKYEMFKKSLLDEDESSEDSEDTGSESEAPGNQDEDSGDNKSKIKKEKNAETTNDVKEDIKPIDATGHDLIAFRKMVYLTIRSSVRHEEVVHKLFKSNIDPALHDELCQMILDCCGQERTYEAIYGLVASKLCQIRRKEFGPIFGRIFELFYEAVHRFETNKIRNIAKFYAHLLTTESIDWSHLSCLKLRVNVTSSPGRCFIKFLFQELVSVLSLKTLIEYIKDPARELGFVDLFPKDKEEDIEFAINFFTFCGLGQLTEGMRVVNS